MKEINRGLNKKFKKLMKDGALDVVKEKTCRYALYLSQVQKTSGSRRRMPSLAHKWSIKLIGIDWINQMPENNRKSIKVKVLRQLNHN